MENSVDAADFGLHRPRAVRDKTPLKAVFSDFTTAHSLITGLTKNNAKSSRDSSLAVSCDEGIPLQIMKPRDWVIPSPRFPAPTVVFHGRTLTNDDDNVQLWQPSSKTNVQEAFGQASLDKGKQPLKERYHWPRDSLELKKSRDATASHMNDIDQKRAVSPTFNKVSDEHDGFKTTFSKSGMPENLSRSFSGLIIQTRAKSVRDQWPKSSDEALDFSTVGTNYKPSQHHVGRFQENDPEILQRRVLFNPTDSNELALHTKKRRQADTSSWTPSSNGRQAVEPVLSDTTAICSRPLAGFSPTSIESTGQRVCSEYPHSSRALSSKSPFGGDKPHKSLVLYSAVDDTLRQARLPKEKEVSQALRRASGYATYSTVALDPVGIVPHRSSRSEASDSLGNQVLKSMQIDEIEIAPSGFYDPNAVSNDWVDGRRCNAVRVPINQQETPPISPPRSPIYRLRAPAARQSIGSNDRDWETIGDSLDSYSQDVPEMLGFKRTGSSCADVSDEGNSLVDPFGSTERIAHHPARMGFAGEYRQRQLIGDGMPVLLPVYGEHKVNGYVSDSMRLRSQPSYYSTPPPLAQTHDNPFQTPPPVMGPIQDRSELETAISKSRMMKNWVWKSRDRNLFPPSRTLATIESDDQPSPVPKMPLNAHQRVEEWTASLRETSPSSDHQSAREQQIETPIGYKRSSWQYIMEHAMIKDPVGDETVPYKESVSGIPSLAYASDGGGYVETQSQGGKYVPSKTHVRQRSIKLPPGAFYNGIRSNSQSYKPSQSKTSRTYKYGAKSTERVPPRHQPTNVLRPLSLLGDGVQSSTTTDMEPRRMGHGQFTYRSPLAPPSRNSWQQLYTPAQMRKLKDEAKADGLYYSRGRLSTGLLNSNEGQACTLILETPRLVAWSQETSHLTTSIQRKRTVSITVLVMCNLFPPLLILYTMGYMDVLMSWWTEGEWSSFCAGQKRLAKWMLGAWAFLIFLAIVAILVLTLRHKISKTV